MPELPPTLPGYENRLIQAREALGLSPAEASRRIGIAQSTWGRWERNEFGKPPDRTGRLAMEYELGIRERWILFGEEPMVRRPIQLDRLADTEQVPCPEGCGMAPHLQSGDILLVHTLELGLESLVQGHIYLHAPEGGRATAGRAVLNSASRRWFLYHDEDREFPGTHIPEALAPDAHLREVMGVIRVFEGLTQA